MSDNEVRMDELLSEFRAEYERYYSEKHPVVEFPKALEEHNDNIAKIKKSLDDLDLTPEQREKVKSEHDDILLDVIVKYRNRGIIIG